MQPVQWQHDLAGLRSQGGWLPPTESISNPVEPLSLEVIRCSLIWRGNTSCQFNLRKLRYAYEKALAFNTDTSKLVSCPADPWPQPAMGLMTPNRMSDFVIQVNVWEEEENVVHRSVNKYMYLQLLRTVLNIIWKHLPNEELYKDLPKIALTTCESQVQFNCHCSIFFLALCHPWNSFHASGNPCIKLTIYHY